MNKADIEAKLIEFALKRSVPFCYFDYIKCPTGRCPKCGSDDLMRISEENGPDYGIDWIIYDLLERELSPTNLEEAFEEFVRQCYGEETKVGWMSFDTAKLMKEMDPVGWRCALGDYESWEECEENIVSFDGGSNYYRRIDLEKLFEIKVG